MVRLALTVVLVVLVLLLDLPVLLLWVGLDLLALVCQQVVEVVGLGQVVVALASLAALADPLMEALLHHWEGQLIQSHPGE